MTLATLTVCSPESALFMLVGAAGAPFSQQCNHGAHLFFPQALSCKAHTCPAPWCCELTAARPVGRGSAHPKGLLLLPCSCTALSGSELPLLPPGLSCKRALELPQRAFSPWAA